MTGQRIYRATEKATGREWYYQVRRIFGRKQFRFALGNMSWAPSLSAAKKAAQDCGKFCYVGEILKTAA